MSDLRRGEVWHADIPERGGPHYYLVVSNNQRNRNLTSALVVPLTTRDRSGLAHLGTQVQLTPADFPARGWVKCDEIFELWGDEVDPGPHCSLTRATLLKVAEALAVALDL